MVYRRKYSSRYSRKPRTYRRVPKYAKKRPYKRTVRSRVPMRLSKVQRTAVTKYRASNAINSQLAMVNMMKAVQALTKIAAEKK